MGLNPTGKGGGLGWSHLISPVTTFTKKKFPLVGLEYLAQLLGNLESGTSAWATGSTLGAGMTVFVRAAHSRSAIESEPAAPVAPVVSADVNSEVSASPPLCDVNVRFHTGRVGGNQEDVAED